MSCTVNVLHVDALGLEQQTVKMAETDDIDVPAAAAPSECAESLLLVKLECFFISALTG